MGRYVGDDLHKETWFGINGAGGTPLHLEVYDSSQDNYIGRDYSGTLSPNTWYHVVAVYDGGTTNSSIKLYLNGVRVDDADGGSGTFVSLANTASIFTVGATGDDYSYPFAGKIDDARVYNRALSATEVKQLYNAER
jgi:Concanavalin A-like lectin/glucanases superfamily